MFKGDLRVRAPAGGNPRGRPSPVGFLDEVDAYREGDWWAPSNGDESDDNSTDGLSRSPPSRIAASARRRRRGHVNDFGGRARPPLRFENLEALELDGCRHVDGLMLDGPRLLALAVPLRDGLSALSVIAPRATHLDCSGCTRLRSVPLKPGRAAHGRRGVARNCQRLDASFLHSFVDHCRHLTHLDVYGAALAEREVKSGSKKSKAGPYIPTRRRIKKSTRAGLSKLTAGRPHLEVVKTRKEHEAPRNATRTTLDLRLSS